MLDRCVAPSATMALWTGGGSDSPVAAVCEGACSLWPTTRTGTRAGAEGGRGEQGVVGERRKREGEGDFRSGKLIPVFHPLPILFPDSSRHTTTHTNASAAPDDGNTRFVTVHRVPGSVLASKNFSHTASRLPHAVIRRDFTCPHDVLRV